MAPAFAVVLLLVLAVAVVGTVRSRTRQGASVAAAVGGFREDPHVVVDPEPFWVVSRIVLVGLVVIYGAVSLVTFRQSASLGQLYADAAAHRMHDVTLSPAPARDSSVTRVVTWQTGLRRWTAQIEVLGGDPQATFSGDPQVTSDDIEAQLLRRDPQLHLHETGQLTPSGFTFGQMRFTGSLGTAAAVFRIGALLLLLATLIGGPEPWRATKWAWFWFISSPPGVLAFCLLSGPTPWIRQPRTARRLTGGVAFVLSLFVDNGSRFMLHHVAAWVLPGHS